MRADPIVAEVRRIREEIAKEAGYDMHKLFQRQKRLCDEWKGEKLMLNQESEIPAPRPATVGES